MKAVLAAALLCVSARAQTVDPNAASAPPAASTDTAVSSGTAASPPPVDLSSSTAGGAAAAAPPKKPAPPANPIRVKLHKEAASWEPYSLRAGGSPDSARNSFSWRLMRGKKAGGKTSKAKSVARLYRAGDDASLVISVFPDKLAEQRTHIELRFLVIEGYLEKAEVAAVTADPGGGPLDDARQLESKGVAYREDSPGSGAIKVSAVDARPSKSALNAGSLSLATFARSELSPNSLGLVSLEYSAKGLTDARKKQPR